MRRTRVLSFVLLTLVALCATLVALPAAAADKAHTFIMAVSNEPDTLDPAVAYAVGDVKFIRAVYEKLVAYKGATTEIEPQLATSWTVSPDAKTYTFKLRQGVKFHDGAPFNAEAVKFSYERLKKVNKGPAWMFENIASIDVVDPYTVKFTLKKPDASFLYILANLSGSGIVSPKAVKEHEVNGDLAQAWLTDHMVGTGPYKFDGWVRGQKLEMSRNTDWWAGWKKKGNKVLDAIQVRIVLEPSTQRMLLESGEVDEAERISMDDMPVVAKQPGIKWVVNESFGIQTIFLNVRHKGLDNKKVRQAVASAIDYDQIIKYIYNGRAAQAQGPLPRGLWGHDDKLPMFKRDIAKAKKLMAESGVKNLTLDFNYGSGSAERRKVAELLQANLKEIGIDLKLTELTGNTIIDKEKKIETAPDLSMWGWWPDYADPANYLDPQYKSDMTPDTGNYNHGWYNNPEVDKLISTAEVTVDHAKQIELYKKVQRIIQDEVPTIPLLQLKNQVMMRDHVKGFVWNAMYEGSFNFPDMYKAK
ncbi:MAG: ABC transporter substrate-binding protein [Chitinophagales bacterium]